MAGSIRDRLTTAVGQLKEAGHHDSAAAVESVLAPGGWSMLKKASGAANTSPLSISIDAQLKAALMDASEEFGVPIRQLAEEAYQKVLSGEWLPPKAGQRKGYVKAVLNVTVDADLRARLREELPRLSEQEGRRISEGNIVVAWACSELGVDTGTGLVMGLTLPRPLRDHFVAARDAGADLAGIVDEGIRRMLSGSWRPVFPGRAAYGTLTGPQQGTLKVRVDDRLRAALHEMAPRLSDEAGVPVFPGTIVRAILTDRLGVPDK